jgi:hypothetical protein
MLNLHARGVVHSTLDFKNQNASNKSRKYGVAKEYMEGKKISGKFCPEAETTGIGRHLEGGGSNITNIRQSS